MNEDHLILLALATSEADAEFIRDLIECRNRPHGPNANEQRLIDIIAKLVAVAKQR